MRRICAALAALTISVPLAASAATSGYAWDSVTRIAMNADQSSLQPGDFNADFSAASAVQAPQQGGGGLFAQMHQAMAMGQTMGQMMQTGIAEHHYVAGTKERTDEISMQTATILDCSARTITTLDLKKKTYRVVSMDQPAGHDSGGGGNGSGRSDDDTHVAITLKNAALGPRDVGGQATNGYRADMTIVETKPSTGESHTQNANMLGYYTGISRPMMSCFGGAPAAGSGHGPGMMMGGYQRLMQALAASGMSSRFSVKQSGPSLPLNEFAMFDAVTFTSEQRGGAATFVEERGNLHAIGANDPAFSIPSDFTQQQ